MAVLESDMVDTEYRVRLGKVKAVHSDRFREPLQCAP